MENRALSLNPLQNLYRIYFKGKFRPFLQKDKGNFKKKEVFFAEMNNSKPESTELQSI